MNPQKGIPIFLFFFKISTRWVNELGGKLGVEQTSTCTAFSFYYVTDQALDQSRDPPSFAASHFICTTKKGLE